MLNFQSFATHNRAGEITYRQIAGLTFEVTIITYTATGPGYTADRSQLEILWGDNTSSVLPRVEEVNLPDYYKRNRYVGTHTYPGAGVYQIVVEDPNRNYGVTNIPNSVNTVFSISTTMYINPVLGVNNTPILTNAPLDKGTVGQTFIHNPGAYDLDGDSLSYKLTECRAENGKPITGYTYPAASKEFYVNEITGDLFWDAPISSGVYNVAILIEEWRNNIKIGEIIRDMQIEILPSSNRPPVIELDEYICVDAGEVIRKIITATDPDNDSVVLRASGGPLYTPVSPASFLPSKGEFVWNTDCTHVRKQPYFLTIKAEDRNEEVILVSMKTMTIEIVGPAVKNPNIEATTTEIFLDWDRNVCNNVVGYNIYRKISPSGFVPEKCEIGVPDRLGFTKIAFLEGINNRNYLDSDVSQGHNYCYLICAVFEDGIESYASEELCANIERGIPTITNVSVEKTDAANGEIYIAWSKPTAIDIGEAPGPYQYVLYRSEGFIGENLQQIASLNNIDDTTFVDIGLDTKNKAYSYKVEFYNNALGDKYLIGSPHIASSVFIIIEQMENSLKINYTKNVPWINTEYTIFRDDPLTMGFNIVGTTDNDNFYIDRGLTNGKEYCYYVKSKGAYTIDGIINPIINLSQIDCAKAIDTTPPCPPLLKGESFCFDRYNLLSWQYNDTCTRDVAKYNIYYTPYLDGEYAKIHDADYNIFSYEHRPELSMAGCYYVTAVDSFRNESKRSNVICLDNCSYYELPNVFTPNEDGINDIYHPILPYYFVKEVDMRIYNRWGLLLYETKDPNINWDGTNYKNGKLVSDGVYYYECNVYEQRLTGVEIRHLQGFIHVYGGIDTTPETRE
jgi:gliding motility-associated-like protein